MPSDKALQQRVEKSFLHDPSLSAFGITVEAFNGAVVLKGTVPNARAKLAAHQLAQAVPGCREVFNEIEVERAGGITDHQISDEVRSLLDNHPQITKGSITVRVHSGLVTLGGAVGTPEEYTLAEDVARSARGVRGVHNLLIIDPGAQEDDESLQLEIESALAAADELSGHNIKVSVSGDLVVLSGQVRDARHKQVAQDLTQAVRAWRVRNEIDVLGEDAYGQGRSAFDQGRLDKAG